MGPNFLRICFLLASFTLVHCGRGLGPIYGEGGGDGDATAAFTLASVAPAAAGRSATLALTGSGFPAELSVTIGGVACRDVTRVSSTLLNCKVPALLATTHDVTITGGSLVETLPSAFTYRAFVYFLSAPGNSVSIFSFARDTGVLSEIASSPFALGNDYNQMAMTSGGEFLYYAATTPGSTREIFTTPVNPIDGSLGAVTLAAPPQSALNAIAVSPRNNFLYASNSDQNEVAAYRPSLTDGALTLLTKSPVFAALFALILHPTEPWLFGADTVNDRVYGFIVNEDLGGLTSNGLESTGDGPFAHALHPNGRNYYEINTLNGVNTIAAFTITPAGVLVALVGETTTVGKPVDVMVTPDGSFVIVANIDDNTLVLFRVDQTTGGLTSVGFPGTTSAPLFLAMDPEARHLYVAEQSSVQAFHLRPEGALNEFDSTATLPDSGSAIIFR